MDTKIIKSKINEVASEIRSLMIEAVFTSHWVIVEAHHEIGKLIIENFGDKMSEVLPSLAQRVGRSERTLYRAAQLYRKFPDIQKLPHGKAISMNRLINEYLIEPGEKEKEQKECEHKFKCVKCGKNETP